MLALLQVGARAGLAIDLLNVPMHVVTAMVRARCRTCGLLLHIGLVDCMLRRCHRHAAAAMQGCLSSRAAPRC